MIQNRDKEREQLAHMAENCKTYIHRFDCPNCRVTNWLDIPKGTEVEEFLKDKTCCNCKCELKRRRW